MPIQTATPSKVFQFIMEIDGVDEFEFQKVDMPDMEIEIAEHGVGTHRVKTGGMIKVGTATVHKLKIFSTGRLWAIEWINTVNNMNLGYVGLAALYKKTIIVRETGGGNLGIPLATEMWIGAFPMKLGRSGKDRLSSDNVLETVQFSIDRIVHF